MDDVLGCCGRVEDCLLAEVDSCCGTGFGALGGEATVVEDIVGAVVVVVVVFEAHVTEVVVDVAGDTFGLTDDNGLRVSGCCCVVVVVVVVVVGVVVIVVVGVVVFVVVLIVVGFGMEEGTGVDSGESAGSSS